MSPAALSSLWSSDKNEGVGKDKKPPTRISPRDPAIVPTPTHGVLRFGRCLPLFILAKEHDLGWRGGQATSLPHEESSQQDPTTVLGHTSPLL